jgi:DNA polymerase-3 subunit delta
MPRPVATPSSTLILVCGEDDFAVSERAREIYKEWTEAIGGMDHEIVDAAASNSSEALKALGKVREAIQTLPFFGSGKVVWMQNCTFLGDDRTAGTNAVTEALADFSRELKEFEWQTVRLLISAGKVDKRKVFYKTLEKTGTVETFSGWSIDDKNWTIQAEQWVESAVKSRGKKIGQDALGEIINRVGPHPRQMNNEVEKLTLYIGSREEITNEDVTTICTRNKTARAFALGDALGDRDLPRLLRRLDEELWEVKLDPKRSEIGLLYGLITKVRAMLLLKEMIAEGWIKQGGDYNRFKAQLERVPQDKLPSDKRFNPLALNPYILYKALPQVARYSQAELTRAMELLFQCNHRLVSSSLDESLVLQQTLVQIVGNANASR